MSKTIFYIDRFRPLGTKLFNSLQDIFSAQKDYKIVFLGPFDKNFHWLSNQKVEGSIGIWTRSHYVRKLFNYIKTKKPDLVHFSFELRTFGTLKSAFKFPFLLFMLKISKIKTIVTLHNVLAVREKSKWGIVQDVPLKIPQFILTIFVNIYIRAICNFSDRIIVLSPSSKLALTDYYRIKEKKIEVISEGVSNVLVMNKSSENENFSNQFKNKKIILCFGVLSPRKGQLIVINGFNLIAKKLPDHVLIIAGRTNPELEYYEKMCHDLSKKLGLENRIFFTGFVEDVDKLFSISEITLFVYRPSVAWPAAFTYSLAHQIPAVVTKVDSFTDFLGDGDVIYIEPDNESQLAEAILDLANNNQLRNKLSNNMKKIATKLSWENVAKSHIEMYKKLTS